MSGILEKHADDNWYTRTFDDFERRLEAGKLPINAIRAFDCYGAECPDCGEKVTAFKYKGGRYLIHASDHWYIHQCPDPTGNGAGGGWPDDPNVRDGNGDIVAHFDWSDEGTEPRSFADDPYSYPDIPYVDPTR